MRSPRLEGVLGILQNIFLFLKENIYCDPSLEPSRRDGSNDGSQNMFLCRIMAKYPLITPVTPSYLEHCAWPCFNINYVIHVYVDPLQ